MRDWQNPDLARDDDGCLIWDYICPTCHAEWTSGDGRCPECHPLAEEAPMIRNLADFVRMLLDELLEYLHTCPEETCA